MSAILKIVYQPYKWIIVIPIMFLNTLVMALISIVAGTVFKPDRADAFAVTWAKIFCAIVPIQVKIRGRHNYNPISSYVVVANHKSMVDIPVLHGFTGLTIKWVIRCKYSNAFIYTIFLSKHLNKV